MTEKSICILAVSITCIPGLPPLLHTNLKCKSFTENFVIQSKKNLYWLRKCWILSHTVFCNQSMINLHHTRLVQKIFWQKCMQRRSSKHSLFCLPMFRPALKWVVSLMERFLCGRRDVYKRENCILLTDGRPRFPQCTLLHCKSCIRTTLVLRIAP